MRQVRYTEDEWRAIDDMRRYWSALCDCDPIPIDSDDFKERLEAHGLARWRKATRRDVEQTSFASDLGIEAGSMLWELTAKGRKLMAPRQTNTN